MTESRKRSLSPQSTGDPPKSENSAFGFAFVSFFKSLAGTRDGTSNNQSNNNKIEGAKFQSVDDPLLNDFVSSKKKRLSIMGHPTVEKVPRSSIVSSTPGIYKNYYENVLVSAQEVNNDVERRMSTVYGPSIVKDGVDNNSTPIKDNSPIQGIEHIENTTFQHLDVANRFLDDTDNNSDLENDFPPLYQDDEGNLVRPPFINLDPRERYQLLQLKKSVDTSQSIERKMKYMVDPNETISSSKGNKVETATQTHDIDFLRSSLCFTNKRRRTQSNNGPTAKKSKRRGFYGGDFTYDLDSIETKFKKSSHKLDGYLGSMSQPKFNESKTTESTTEVDEQQPFNKFSKQNVKSTQQRVGLDQSLLKNQKIKTILDPEYVNKVEALSNIIKIKDNVPKESKASDNTPSAGFKFNINKNDVDSILNTRTENQKLVNSSSIVPPSLANGSSLKSDLEKKSSENEPKAAIPSLFGLKDSEKSTNAPLLFGTKDKEDTDLPRKKRSLFNNDSSTASTGGLFANSTQNATPSFSFGSKPSSNTSEAKETPSLGQEAPKAQKPSTDVGFSFSKPDAKESTSLLTEKPKFLFGVPQDNANKKLLFSAEPEKADAGSSKTFLFSAPNSSSSEPKPLNFSFGSSKESTSVNTKEDKDKAPSSGILQTTEATTGFSFGASKDASIKPAPFLLGTSKKEAGSTFSFGKPASTEEKKEVAAPFTFGEKKDTGSKPEAAKTTGFSFGSNKTETTSEPAKTTPFQFGAKSDTSSGSPQPFSFGATSSKVNTDVKPASEPTKAFSFGKTPEAGDSSKPAFSFGTSSTPTVNKTSTLFGQATAATTTTQEKSPFGFGGTPQPATQDSNKPAFSFGAADSRESTPALSTTPKPFGNPNFQFAAGIQPNNSFTNANNASTPGGLFGGAAGLSSGNTNGGFTFKQGNDGSRQTTPTSFNFGSASTVADPASIFGQTNNAPVNSGANTFNFSGSSRAATPNPSDIFNGGGMNNGFANNAISMPQPQFGTPQANNVFAGTTPTPPLQGMPNNRKIAMMRKRRGH